MCFEKKTTINVVFSSKPCLINRSEVVGVSVSSVVDMPQKGWWTWPRSQISTLFDMEKQSSIYIYIHTRILVYIYIQYIYIYIIIYYTWYKLHIIWSTKYIYIYRYYISKAGINQPVFDGFRAYYCCTYIIHVLKEKHRCPQWPRRAPDGCYSSVSLGRRENKEGRQTVTPKTDSQL